MGDYIVKGLLGCVDPTIHAIDLPSGASLYGGWGGGWGQQYTYQQGPGGAVYYNQTAGPCCCFIS
jgi:hypothetical protein